MQFSRLLLLVGHGLSCVAAASVSGGDDATACHAPLKGNGHGAAMTQFRASMKEEAVKSATEESPAVWAAAAIAAAATSGAGLAAFTQQPPKNRTNLMQHLIAFAQQPTENRTRSTSVTSSSESDTSAVGTEQEVNLTRQVHKQAGVVAKSAGRLVTVKENNSMSVDELSDDYKNKKQAADAAKEAYDKVSADMEEKKAAKEKLRDATQAAEQALWRLQKQYMDAEQAYEKVREDVSAADDNAEEASDARDVAERTMTNTIEKIEYETNALQDNIDKLNDLNEGLKDAQADAPDAKNSAARAGVVFAFALLLFVLH